MTAPARRLRDCVENWPEAETGSYDPRCCRFPKSCSATVYDEDRVADSDLEPVAPASRSATERPHGAFNCDMAGLPHAGPCDDVRPLAELRSWPPIEPAPDDLRAFVGESGRAYMRLTGVASASRPLFHPAEAGFSRHHVAAARTLSHWREVDGPLRELAVAPDLPDA